MNRKQWKRISEVTASALERDGQDRIAFLNETCGTDSGLRKEVERLLREHERAGSFMENPPIQAPFGRAGSKANRVFPKPRDLEAETVSPNSLIYKGVAEHEGPADKESYLPWELLQKVPQRLRFVSLAYAISFVTIDLFTQFSVHVLMGVPYELRAHMVSLLIVLTITAVSIMVFILAKPGRLNPQRIVKLGLYYEVFGSVGIAFATVYGETNFENIWGVSAICIWVIAYVGFVPLPPNKATIAAFTSAAMGPLALAVWVMVAGLPVPSAAVFLGLSVPIFVCAAMASIGARMLYQLGKNVDRALQMGSYRLERLLGRGGMGEVWLARHQMLVRPAAIKLVRPDFWGGDLSEVVFRRFEREAQATATLTSPHTIQLYDFGFTKEGIFYYVMELLEGTDLDSLVKRFGPLPPARATRFLQQACLSLAEAHARGMVHRDIKPANMYTCCLGLDYDFVKLLDFGLVRPLKKADGDEARLTIQGFPPGTPGYMAPEVVSGREADEGADIYALGCVGYWLITGRPVFEGATILEILMNHVHSPPPLPSEQVQQEVPKELEKIILWCLEKDPSNRPASVEELKRHLDSFALKDPWTQDRAREWVVATPSAAGKG